MSDSVSTAAWDLVKALDAGVRSISTAVYKEGRLEPLKYEISADAYMRQLEALRAELIKNA